MSRWTIAETRFLKQLTDLNCELLEPYSGSKHKHRVRCPQGHLSLLRPNWLQQGNGTCKTCSGKDSAEGRYRAHLASIGATPAWPEWTGVMKQHTVVCPAGHLCSPRPNTVMTRGQGVCVKCSGRDTWSAEARFKAYLSSLGATPAWGTWHGQKQKHLITCSEGHVTDVWPTAHNSGRGVCRICKGYVWDAFYVVSGSDVVKFGVTTGDVRGRIGTHRRDGIGTVHRTFTKLPDGHAKHCEDQLRAAMDNVGFTPLHGSREYFPIEALDTILGFVDNELSPWLTT
jgi:hypothetical protein